MLLAHTELREVIKFHNIFTATYVAKPKFLKPPITSTVSRLDICDQPPTSWISLAWADGIVRRSPEPVSAAAVNAGITEQVGANLLLPPGNFGLPSMLTINYPIRDENLFAHRPVG